MHMFSSAAAEKSDTILQRSRKVLKLVIHFKSFAANSSILECLPSVWNIPSFIHEDRLAFEKQNISSG